MNNQKSKNAALIEQIEKEFIPAVREMLQKEEAHLNNLQEKRAKLFKINASNGFLYDIDDIIKNSKKSKEFLSARLNEYKEYCQKHKIQ